jgi:hypothetical protein
VIVVKCEMCGEELEFPDSLAGTTDTCPNCKAQVVVTAVSGPAIPPPPSPRGVPSRSQPLATSRTAPRDPYPGRTTAQVLEVLGILVLMIGSVILLIGMVSLASDSFLAKAVGMNALLIGVVCMVESVLFFAPAAIIRNTGRTMLAVEQMARTH